MGLTWAWCVCYGGGAENNNAGIRGHGHFSTGLFALAVLRLPTRVRGEAGFLEGTAKAQRVNSSASIFGVTYLHNVLRGIIRYPFLLL